LFAFLYVVMSGRVAVHRRTLLSCEWRSDDSDFRLNRHDVTGHVHEEVIALDDSQTAELHWPRPLKWAT
jgi:hypothetical protein